MGIKYRCSCIGAYLLCKGRCQPSHDVTSASLLVTKVGDRGSFGLLDSYKPTHFSGWVVDNIPRMIEMCLKPVIFIKCKILPVQAQSVVYQF